MLTFITVDDKTEREQVLANQRLNLNLFLKNLKLFDYYGYDFVNYLQKDTYIQYKSHTETPVITGNGEKLKL